MLPTHPDYIEDSIYWEKYRLTYEGGKPFVNKYLEYYSTRETASDFAFRKKITYCPAHAKAAIVEINNSIFERMGDVLRMGGPQSYQEAIAGVEGGVDFTGRNMTSFIGKEILPELLVMRRVGVFIDKAPLSQNRTRAEEKGIRPYLYVYKAEDIFSWAYDDKNRLISVLLRSYVDTIDEKTGLTTGEKEVFKLLRVMDGAVTITEMQVDGQAGETKNLNLTQIPFVIFEMTESLMKDIADYQIALLNLESSDMAYLIKSNFPFYTEQSNPLADNASLARQATVTHDADGKEVVSQTAEDRQTVSVGSTTGRRYPKGTERPGFIHPSPEPMEVSMAKQEKMKMAIRQLVQLALTNLAPQRSSAESKDKDQQGLEAGLAAIGLELETGENKIAKLWGEYEGETPAIVAYPDQYSLQTDEERVAKAEKLITQLPKIPSITFQKKLAIQIALLLASRSLTLADEQKIIAEINNATIIAVDPEVLLSDLEAGLVAAETASLARGYPKGDVETARKEHIARLAAIAVAQAKGGGAGSDAARGIPAGPQDKSGDDEKKESQNADLQKAGTGTAVRGKE